MKLTVGQNIRGYRKERGLTQEQLAEALGVTIGAVSKWESDLSRPELELLVELADFFEVSIDVLLGYEWQNHNITSSVERITKFIQEKDFEEGCREAEKALQKYKNSFTILYRSALLYNMKGIEQKSEQSLRRALMLYQQSILFLSQNTEEDISELLLYNRMAEIYVLLGETEEALTLFKKNNFDGINSGKIGLTLTFENKYKEALPYLSASMLESVSELFRDATGFFNCFYEEKNSEKAIEMVEWMRSIVQGLRLPGRTNYADKMDTVLLALLALAKSQNKDEAGAREALLLAVKISAAFDTAPNYCASGINFYYGEEQPLVDDCGQTGKDSIEHVLTEANDKELLKMWHALNEGGVS